ncbi:hypothetical protein Poly41_71760 [Novipirellula artificiosorum]|uniref:Uncharacterized protein n=1 Tax=Novipirellula artificiosorum TaxID=2528016 RepID=A0A5C6C8G2_9BACT|nr:hypothetical protein Poly41_71760 [Novipirellula artificiosorum]
MRVDFPGFTLGAVFLADIRLFPQRFLLFRIHRNRWSSASPTGTHTTGNVFKLRIAVGMIRSFSRLAITLQRIAERAEYFGNFGAPNSKALRDQLTLKITQTLARPSQWRLWITTLGRFHKTIDRVNKIPLCVLQRLSASTRSSLTTARQRVVALQFLYSLAYGNV